MASKKATTTTMSLLETRTTLQADPRGLPTRPLSAVHGLTGPWTRGPVSLRTQTIDEHIKVEGLPYQSLLGQYMRWRGRLAMAEA